MADADSIRREKARLRAAAWYANNKERAAATAKKFRQENPELVRERKRAEYLRNREKAIKRSAEYMQNNREQRREYDRQYRLKNAKRLEALKVVWRADNADLLRAVKHSYKARRRAVEKTGDSSRQVRAWLARVPKTCIWCGIKCADDFHIDHFMPLALGGAHAVANLAIACPTCNVRKNAMHPETFCKRMGFDYGAVVERHRCDVGMLV